MTDSTYNRLLKRVVSDPKVLIIDHYPPLTEDDVRVAVAYAAELTGTVSAHENQV
jgi:hypothetical protein